jgi:hypothetical protein
MMNTGSSRVLYVLHKRALAVLAGAPKDCKYPFLDGPGEKPTIRRTNPIRSSEIRVFRKNCSNLGAGAPEWYSTGASLVMRSSGRCSRSFAVRRSRVPFSTVKSHGLASRASEDTVTSGRVRESMAFIRVRFEIG